MPLRTRNLRAGNHEDFIVVLILGVGQSCSYIGLRTVISNRDDPHTFRDSRIDNRLGCHRFIPHIIRPSKRMNVKIRDVKLGAAVEVLNLVNIHMSSS